MPEKPAATAPHDLLKSYPEGQPKWVGRTAEIEKLETAWETGAARVYAVVGFGGQGKSALARKFVEPLRRHKDDRQRPVAVWWSFYLHRSADEFFDTAARHLGIRTQDEETGNKLTSERLAAKLVQKLGDGVNGRRLLLVLDGLEVLQDQTAGREGWLTDAAVQALIRGALNEIPPGAAHGGMILVTTRARLSDLRREDDPAYGEIPLDELSVPDGVALLRERYGLQIEADEVKEFVEEVRGHALTLALTGSLLGRSGATTATLKRLRDFIASQEAKVRGRDLTTRGEPGKRPHRLPGYVLRHCRDALSAEERQFMRLLSCCVRPATPQDIEEIFLQALDESDAGRAINDKLVGKDYLSASVGIVGHLRALRLVDGDEDTGYDTHPLIRRHFYEKETGTNILNDEKRKAIHARFFDVLSKRPKKHHPDTLEEMQPLIDAVLHGCRAGRTQTAFNEVYYTRIGRIHASEPDSYLVDRFGAGETERELLSAFFPWGNLDSQPILSDARDRAFLVNACAVALSITGHPGLAVPVYGRSLNANRRRNDWVNTVRVCFGLCRTYTEMGRLHEAERAAAEALDYIGRLGDKHCLREGFASFADGDVGKVAALRGQSNPAAQYFSRALGFDRVHWVHSSWRCYHSMWLARRGVFNEARISAEKNSGLCARDGGLNSKTFTLMTQALVERLAWAAGDPKRCSVDQMRKYTANAIEVSRRSGFHFHVTSALLEAARCGIASAVHDADRREEFIAQARNRLGEAEDRAKYAEYRLILADAHVGRAEIAKLTGDEKSIREHCAAVIAICDDPDCGYAWAKEDAQRLLGN